MKSSNTGRLWSQIQRFSHLSLLRNTIYLRLNRKTNFKLGPFTAANIIQNISTFCF